MHGGKGASATENCADAVENGAGAGVGVLAQGDRGRQRAPRYEPTAGGAGACSRGGEGEARPQNVGILREERLVDDAPPVVAGVKVRVREAKQDLLQRCSRRQKGGRALCPER